MVVRAAGATASRIVSGTFNDITGTDRSDRLILRAEGALADAENLLRGEGGADLLVARSIATGTGNAAFNTVWGGTGDDNLLISAQGQFRLASFGYGGLGDDTIRLRQAGADGDLNCASFLGGDGHDFFDLVLVADGDYGQRPLLNTYGDAGRDLIRSTIVGDNAIHGLSGGSGADTLIGAARGIGTVEQELFGGSGNDLLRGTIALDGASVLRGGRGNDRLVVVGGEDNQLLGGRGNDVLVLGDGADTFRFSSFSGGRDVVRNWDPAEDAMAIFGLDAGVVVTDNGTDAVATFANGASVVFKGAGDGTVDSIFDLVDDPGQVSESGWF